MYKIHKVTIEQFWNRTRVECAFNDHVNIVIGKNGTGKTTFMNILFAALTVNVDELAMNDFEEIEISLRNKSSKRIIKVKKQDQFDGPFQIYEYQLSKKKFIVRHVPVDDQRYLSSARRRTLMEADELKEILRELVSVSSISVYRLRSGDEQEPRQKHGSQILTPVDSRLSMLLRQLTQYQLQLSQKAREIATQLQKDVLASILYSKDDENELGYSLSFNKLAERDSLIAAYSQLNAIDTNIEKKIDFHVNAIDETVSSISKRTKFDEIDISSLEALRKTKKIIAMSLQAEEETSKIYSQLSLFNELVASFITDKFFEVGPNTLKISNEHGEIEHQKLSSGEKQLLILMIETLLQRQAQHVFLADEPEISLHIEWQRKIIPAVRKLNPNAQVIVATHSPEVAAPFKDDIINMKDIANG